MDKLDNLLVAVCAVAGFYVHLRVLLRCRSRMTRVRCYIKVLCLLALVVVFINESVYVLGVLDSRDAFALGTALLTASLMSLGMSDWGDWRAN